MAFVNIQVNIWTAEKLQKLKKVNKYQEIFKSRTQRIREKNIDTIKKKWWMKGSSRLSGIIDLHNLKYNETKKNLPGIYPEYRKL